MLSAVAPQLSTLHHSQALVWCGTHAYCMQYMTCNTIWRIWHLRMHPLVALPALKPPV